MVGKQSGAVVQQLLHEILLDLIRDEVKAMSMQGDAKSNSGRGARTVCSWCSRRSAYVVVNCQNAIISGGHEQNLSAARYSSTEGQHRRLLDSLHFTAEVHCSRNGLVGFVLAEATRVAMQLSLAPA
jgi:hypothetical protein